ncbi:energy transducer TonB [Candidatus Cloacimonadota bacterium]
MKYLIFIIISLALISCSYNDKYSTFKLNYIQDGAIRSTKFKKITPPVIQYIHFSEFFWNESDLDEKNITLHIRILDSGKVDSVMVDCVETITRTAVNEISKNINDWKFTPAKDKNGKAVTASVSFNWNSIYHIWEPLFANPDLLDKYKVDPVVQDVSKTKPVKTVNPVISSETLMNGNTGMVFFYVHADPEGKLDKIIVSQTADDNLTQSAIEAVEQWEYEPLINDRGEKISCWYFTGVGFQIE